MNKETSTTGVHKANDCNSTDFTNCCGSAVCSDQYHCPHCGIEVVR